MRMSGKSLALPSETINLQLPKQMVSALCLKYVIAYGQNSEFCQRPVKDLHDRPVSRK